MIFNRWCHSSIFPWSSASCFLWNQQFAHTHCKARRTNKVSTARKYTSLKNVDELLESQFGIIWFKDSDSDINFYTGFPNYKTLLACYNLLNPGENGENIVYVNSATKDLDFSASSNVDGSQGNKLGRHRELSILMSSLLSMLEWGLGYLDLIWPTDSECMFPQ